ncbi:MAG: glycosyltransferase [Clostridia bacterium]|nr:glycosyltransferase [Clostridia bacterium]
MNDLVSVVLPTYCRKREMLERAVSSVLNQTYENTEIIIVDDSPSDYEYRADIADYAATLPGDRVIYVQNEKNLGGSLSRNRGIELARGRYITFLDDDDEYTERKIEKQVAFMKETDCDLSFSNMIMYNENGTVVDFREYSSIKSFDNDYLLKYHLLHHMTGTPTFMFKAEKLREIGGFEKALVGQEFRLMLKSIESGLKIRYMNDCDIKVYRYSDGGISYGKNKIRGEKELYSVKQKYFDRLTPREIRFVKFRYHAVMAIAYKRNRMYPKMIAEGITAVAASPSAFAGELTGFVKKIKQHRGE